MAEKKYSGNSIFKSGVDTAYDIGKIKSKKYTDVSKFKDLANNIKTRPMSDNSPFSSLGNVTVPYGGSTEYEKYHPGVDIANQVGTKIPAYTGGTVKEVVSGKGWTPGTPSFGNYAVIQDAQGNYQRYSHLKQSYVKVGQQIEKGTPLGEMGYTGSTYSPSHPNDPKYASHLDYRIYDAAKRYYNPSEYLASYRY